MPDFHSAKGVADHLRQTPVRHLVDGRLEDSPGTFDVIDPATGRAAAICPEATREQLDRAVAGARRAQPDWARLPAQERAAQLRRFGQALLDHTDELAALITLEQGKPLAFARMEVQWAAGQLAQLTSIALEPDILRDDAGGRVELRYRPLGVAAAITPWNMPVILAVPKIAHALYTGNTLVLKPSPKTPLATLRLGELARDLLPPGALNILAGGDELGRCMVSHPGIDKISFTGSVRAGKQVMAAAAHSLKRVTLELGGNDAAIVLDDADLEAIAPRLFQAAFANSGQICMAIKRLFVHESIHGAACEALAALARAAVVGDGFQDGVELGPVQNRAQFDIVRGILDDTQRRGAQIHAGGQVLERPGYFVSPTVASGIAEGSRLVDEEPFGPVLPVLSFSTEDEAVARANNTRFGLGASVWSADPQRAARIAVRLEAGVSWVNQHLAIDPFVPFGGAKDSGIGREFGRDGLRQYMEQHAVMVPAARG